MPVKPPKTFVELVKHLETTLKTGEHFFVAFSSSQRDPVALKSLKLKEIRCFKKGRSTEVTLMLEGLFKGRHGPHKFEATNKFLAELGVSELSVGAGAWPFANGTTVKGLSVKVRPALIEASLADALDAATGAKAERLEAAAIKAVEASKAYREGLLRISEIDKEVRRLSKLSGTVKGKLERMTVKAMLKARTRQSPKSVIRKSPYTVVVL